MQRNLLSRRNIAQTFNRISSCYDFINTCLSLGMQNSWRKACSFHIPQGAALQAVDLATGTCDQILALAKNPCIASFIGYDLAEKMLAIGQAKIQKKGLSHKVHLEVANALEIPLKTATCDLVTISFGIRNVTDPIVCLQEMARILRPKGRALILEFSLPENRFIQKIALFYLRKILPPIGGMLSGNREAYQYLQETIETFPCGDEFLGMMQSTGFCNTYRISMALGAVTLYVGEKP